jgi:four helix bundle protein
MGDFRKLNVWRKAHTLALDVERATTKIRRSDHASLRSQLLRAAMSVPTNIVEGSGQRTAREFGRFVRIALNSASELEYHLMLAKDFRAMSASDAGALSAQAVEVRKMLYGLSKRLSISTSNLQSPKAPAGSN